MSTQSVSPATRASAPELASLVRGLAGAELPIVLNVGNPTSAAVRSELLRVAGYRVVDCASAAEALAAIRRCSVSVAVVDVGLPDVSGLILCEMLKRMEPALLVILISMTSHTAHSLSAARAAGAHCQLSDASTRDALVDKVADALAGLTEHGEPGTWVVTDSLGFIMDANLAGARLLNGTIRGLQQRNLLLFFADNRPFWKSALTRALTGERVLCSGRLRPKEKRPLMLSVEISRATAWERPALQWIFQPLRSSTG